MTNDTLQLDSNFNAIITEEKIRLNNTEDSIYKNTNRFKHNDIVYIPSIIEIDKILVSISEFPLRYKNITGTKRFKELKDYLLTYNLLQQYFSSHSEDKSLIALDSRYLSKALGSRYNNNQNKFFNEFFKLEIKGKKGNYTSGFSMTDEAINNIGNYKKIIHTDKLDNIIKDILLGEYIENKIVNINNSISLNKIEEEIFNSSILIPEDNIDLINSMDNVKYKRVITNINNNYKNGRLYFNKDYKPYGRNYSYIHSLPREVRKNLFDGFTELDLSSAAQTILLRLTENKIKDKLAFITDYVNNKDEVRQKLMQELKLNMNEVKELIQIVTFNSRVPSISQLAYFKSYKKFEDCITNNFILGLSKDLKIIDEYLLEILSNEDKEIIKKHKGNIKAIDVRVFTFQNTESKIMEKIQSILKRESFHLHDAVYVKDLSNDELNEILKYSKKIRININNITLVSKKYDKNIPIKHIKILKNIGFKLNSEYKNNVTPTEYICTCGNITIRTPKGIKETTKCNCNLVKNHETYIKRLNEKKINTIPLEKYVNTSTKIKHKCICGNIWNVNPNTVLLGNKCKKCTIFDYNKELKNKQIDVIPLEEYKDSHTKIKHKCICGNEWDITPNNVLNGVLCGCINNTNINKEKIYKGQKTIIYYIKINNIYKIGITLFKEKYRTIERNILNKRYSGNNKLAKNNSINIIKTKVFDDGLDAIKLEKEIIDKYKDYKYLGKRFIISKYKSGGESECFIKDIKPNLEGEIIWQEKE